MSPDFLPASPQNSNLVGTGIDISHLDPKLDSIPLKPTAVPPKIVEQVMSDSSSKIRSPLGANHSPPKKLDPNNLGPLSAPETMLTRHAGHTPNASLSKFDLDSGVISGEETPTQESHSPKDFYVTATTVAAGQNVLRTNPLLLQAEGLDGVVDVEHDIALKGPLALEANGGIKSDEFLKEVTARLEEVKRNIPPTERSSVMSDDDNNDEGVVGMLAEENEDDDEPEVKLRLRKSSNFGCEFGSLKGWPST
jgi:hypothetical protein